MAQSAKVHATQDHSSKSKARDSEMRHSTHKKNAYRTLAWTGLLQLPLMYLVMFSMVYSTDEIFHNLNTLYMAGMMVAPMLALMPLFMRGMYPNRVLNFVVYGVAIAVFAALFLFTRSQTFIGDRQFLRSMIPHHSGAILMCEKASLHDPEITDLCQQIVRGQKAEIEQMKKILGRM